MHVCIPPLLGSVVVHNIVLGLARASASLQLDYGCVVVVVVIALPVPCVAMMEATVQYNHGTNDVEIDNVDDDERSDRKCSSRIK
jgi:hypothetical protein